MNRPVPPSPPAATAIETGTLPRLQRSSGSVRISAKMRDGRTVPDLHFEEGCAKVRFPRIRSRDGLEAILINTSGGMTGGDAIEWEIATAAGAAMTVTTQACEKVYRSTRDPAKVRARIRVGEGSSLTWLPQETILFDAARLGRRLEAELGEGASLLVCEPVVFGRTGRGERFRTGMFTDRWEVRKNGRLAHLEATRIAGDDVGALSRTACLNGNQAMANVLFIGEMPENTVEEARKLLEDFGKVTSGVSAWRLAAAGGGDGTGKFLARLIADDSYELRRALVALLPLLNNGAPMPRSWAI